MREQLHLLADYQAKESKVWKPKPNERMIQYDARQHRFDESKLHETLSPEAACMLEASLHGEQRLRDLNINRLHDPTGIDRLWDRLKGSSSDERLEKKKLAMHIHEQLQWMPWTLTSNFVDFKRGRCLLDFINGVADPSGKGEALGRELGGLGFTGSNLEPDDLKRFVDRTMERYGRVDAVINGAGHGPKGEVLAISEAGLVARGRAGSGGLVPDETHFLNALRESVESGKVPADELVEQFEGDWGGDLSRIYAAHSY